LLNIKSKLYTAGGEYHMFNLHAPFTKHLGYLSSGTDMVAIVTIESIERKKNFLPILL